MRGACVLNSARIWLSEREYRKAPGDFLKKALYLCGNGMGSRHQYHAYSLQWKWVGSGEIWNRDMRNMQTDM